MSVRRRGLQTLRPSVEGASFVRLSPDRRRLAFTRQVGADRVAVCVCDAAPDAPAAVWLELRPGWKVRQLAWAPEPEGAAPPAAALGLVVSRARQARHELCVGWLAGPARPLEVAAEVEAADEPDDPAPGLAHVAGHSFAWAAGGRTLLVADVAARQLVAVPVRSRRRIPLAALPDDGHPGFPPHVVPAPGGKRVAFTCRRLDDAASELWVYEHGRGPTLLTAVPGSQLCAYALWSPKGRTLALYVVHREQDKTGLIAVPELAGEGVILFRSARAEPACAPAWAPSGRSIVLWASEGAAVARLCALDPGTGALTPLGEPGELSGSPRFVAPDTLLVDGADAAHLVTLEA